MSAKEDRKLEKRTERNMELITAFIEHYNRETGKEIPERVVLSFFDA